MKESKRIIERREQQWKKYKKHREAIKRAWRDVENEKKSR